MSIKTNFTKCKNSEKSTDTQIIQTASIPGSQFGALRHNTCQLTHVYTMVVSHPTVSYVHFSVLSIETWRCVSYAGNVQRTPSSEVFGINNSKAIDWQNHSFSILHMSAYKPGLNSGQVSNKWPGLK